MIHTLGEIESIAGDLKEKKLESIDVKLFVEKADPALDAYLAGQMRQALRDVPVTVTSQGITEPIPVF